MISCKFQIDHALLSELDSFAERFDYQNISIFENVYLGFSKDLDDNGFPIANFFDVEILLLSDEDANILHERIIESFKTGLQNFAKSILKDEDWVLKYEQEIKPAVCGKFFFYNDVQKLEDFNTNDLIPIKLSSALAFGSGHHQTTKGCLLNISHISENGFKPESILDMGCGTGILGIGALKLWKDSKLLGIDIDPEAVRITLDNYSENNVVGCAVTSDSVPIDKTFDLILCNILKQPLIDMCSDFWKVLNTGGFIITSGYITSQENDVISRFEKECFKLANRIQIEDWLSILFKKEG